MTPKAKGWQGRLQKQYVDFAEFEAYSDIYGLAKRLGYKSAKSAWKANPTIAGSVYPEDYRVISRHPRKARKVA